MNHALVKCLICNLVYAPSPPDENSLKNAYHVAEYDSSEEANDAAFSYLKAIKPFLQTLKTKESVLEIGTGTGVFLELLQKEGFKELIGIEPSSAAIAAAPPSRQIWIRQDIFRSNTFALNSLDFVCCFMTMEHVKDPGILINEVYSLLKPGGIFAIVTHDFEAPINKLLGKKSPIIDIEHLQLFSKKSLNTMFNKAGFTKCSIIKFSNSYSIFYWLKLMPLPIGLKILLSRILKTIGIGKLKLTIDVGNLMTVGIKTYG